MTPTEFLREYETSGRTGGVDYTLSLIDDNAVYWFSDGTAHVGKRAVEQAIRRNFNAIKHETYRISDVLWVPSRPTSLLASTALTGPASSMPPRQPVRVVALRSSLAKVSPGWLFTNI
jgi:hypothetical protein